jgi:hypothetical protein
MIAEYTIEYNEEAFQVFPPEMYGNPYLVYHGTSKLFSNRIETKGFIRGHLPFDQNGINTLLQLLSVPLIAALDTDNGVYGTVQSVISRYLEYAHSKPISFAPVSASSLRFAIGDVKGGQILKFIIQGFDIVFKAQAMRILDKDLEDKFNSILAEYYFCKEILNEQGVIYAVNVRDLSGIRFDHFVIFSDNNVPPERIIGKMVISKDFDYAPVEKYSETHLPVIRSLSLELEHILNRDETVE